MDTRICDEVILASARAYDLREHGAIGHAERVARLTVRLAEMMKLGPQDTVYAYWGALLHDIGMVGVPESVLHKPGSLSDREWEIVRRHPVISREILSDVEELRPALAIPLSHHERMDGSGYPEGLRGDAIPLAARLFAVVDTWDSLLSPRPYRPAWAVTRARGYLQLRAHEHFDADVVAAFLKLREVAAA
jgi:putative two-component system response regulator